MGMRFIHLGVNYHISPFHPPNRAEALNALSSLSKLGARDERDQWLVPRQVIWPSALRCETVTWWHRITRLN
ncbi:hypothetical protein HYQ46_006519 [Verticillium longisporum]|nr:hypothetical protein HYQ46_006519 [Verticillium longisporum]